MTATTPQVVTDYLSRLDLALADIEPEVRGEIVAGIREELDGLGSADATARVVELGDPSFIAAEARAGLTAADAGGPPPGRTLSIVAVLVLFVGAFVVPVIGPLIGLVWLSFSSAWSRREKISAWLIPLAAGVILVGGTAIAASLQQPDAVNPVLPLGALAGWHVTILVAYLILPIEGIVLLVRASRRGWMPRPPLPRRR